MRHSKTVTDPTSAAASETTTHIWGGSNIVYDKVERVLSGGSVEVSGTKYVRGLGLIARQTEAGGDYEHYMMNAHGDVVQIIGENGSGGVVQDYTFTSFGVEEDPDDADTNPYRYSGQYYDKETGTYYLCVRYYEPRLGRFLAEDPHWNPSNNTEDITAIMQSGNLYVYCMNNPILYVDQNGEFVWIAVSAAIGAGIGIVSQIASNLATGTKWNEGVLGAAAGGAVYGAVLATTANPAVAGFAAAATESVVNEATKYHSKLADINGYTETKELTKENVGDSLKTVAIDTAVNGSMYALAGKASKVLKPTNKGWFKPQKLESSLVGKYAQKAHAQTALMGSIVVGARATAYPLTSEYQKNHKSSYTPPPTNSNASFRGPV